MSDREDALLIQIAKKIRALHHYGNPPDVRLQEDVDGDVDDILADVQALVDTLRQERDAWQQRGTFAESELARAETREAALRTVGDRLTGYVWHKPNCATMHPSTGKFSAIECDCGYVDAQEAWARLSPENPE